MENKTILTALEECMNWMESLRASTDAGFWEWKDDEYTRAQEVLNEYKNELKMETPHLDEEINNLKAHLRANALTTFGIDKLREYEAIKQKLNSEQLTCPHCNSTNCLLPNKENDAECNDCGFIWEG